MTRTTAVLAAILGVALLGLATNATERVTHDASAAPSSTPVTYQRTAESGSVRGVHSHRWDGLSEPAAEATWCVNEDAVYASCGDGPDRIRAELLH
jgi:hypothetical protein